MVNVAKIFIIVVTYKGHIWYERCFTSLRESVYPIKTVVVDNASNDGTVEYVRENFPEIHLIETKENLGFGRANNIGMRYALDHGCDYVFLLNQDAWIESNTIDELIRIHQKYTTYGILSPMHITKDKKGIECNFISFITHNNTNLCRFMLEDMYFGKLRDVYTSRYANAAAWLLPRKTLEVIGGFCPLIYHYGEDDDYLNRLHYHGMELGICPHTRIVHDAKLKSKFSVSLSHKARLLDVDEIIDINNPNSLKRQTMILLSKFLKSTLRGQRENAFENRLKLKYILKNYKRLQYCMRMHKDKQSCWL